MKKRDAVSFYKNIGTFTERTATAAAATKERYGVLEIETQTQTENEKWYANERDQNDEGDNVE